MHPTASTARRDDPRHPAALPLVAAPLPPARESSGPEPRARMHPTASTSPRNDLRRPATLALVAAPLLLTAGDTLGMLTRQETIHWTLLLWLSFVVFVPAVFALAHLVRTRAPRAGLVLGGVALFGTMMGASMQVFFRAGIALQQASDAAATAAIEPVAQRAWAPPSLFFMTTVAPGLFFPLGMLGLGIALAVGRQVTRGAALLLCLGAVLFPVGHAVGIPVALIGGDLVLVAALSWIAAEVRRRPELWGGGGTMS